MLDPEQVADDAMSAARQSGRTAQAELMLTLLGWLRRDVDGMPAVATDALGAADRHWRLGVGTADDLTAARVACWQHLDAKNGNSTTIDGLGDYLTRAAICLLYPEHSDGEDNLVETAHWFREFLVSAEEGR